MHSDRSTLRRLRPLATVMIVVAVLAGGCRIGHTTRTITGSPPPTTITKHHHPDPTTTVVKGYPTYRAGVTGTIGVPSQGASMTITAAVPKVSTTRLSPSYGYPPEHGYYVTFPLVITNSGHASLLIERLDFFVRTPGLGKVNTNEGAAPYSGSPRQLDSTLLAPGKTLRNNLTFDVSSPKGTFYYAPGGKPSIAWTFGT
jgi:hypothetical protein